MTAKVIGTLLDEDPKPSPKELRRELAECISRLMGVFGDAAVFRPSREARVCLVR